MINISAQGRKHAKPWFMTPKRKKFYDRWKKTKSLPRVLINEVDEVLDSLARKDIS